MRVGEARNGIMLGSRHVARLVAARVIVARRSLLPQHRLSPPPSAPASPLVCRLETSPHGHERPAFERRASEELLHVKTSRPGSVEHGGTF